ncbi:MAG: ankyrin repeat domain-containing protein [Hyphomicrobiaceae bacterium]|nr:ankyrin repeat domain-containing protein [Hyphomicrobiaceae bacterium]
MGPPLLHLAAANGHVACVELLLARGFDVNARDRTNRATALHWAAHGGHIEGCQAPGGGRRRYRGPR